MVGSQRLTAWAMDQPYLSVPDMFEQYNSYMIVAFFEPDRVAYL
jgi:hypothetical protein